MITQYIPHKNTILTAIIGILTVSMPCKAAEDQPGMVSSQPSLLEQIAEESRHLEAYHTAVIAAQASNQTAHTALDLTAGAGALYGAYQCYQQRNVIRDLPSRFPTGLELPAFVAVGKAVAGPIISCILVSYGYFKTKEFFNASLEGKLNRLQTETNARIQALERRLTTEMHDIEQQVSQLNTIIARTNHNAAVLEKSLQGQSKTTADSLSQMSESLTTIHLAHGDIQLTNNQMRTDITEAHAILKRLVPIIRKISDRSALEVSSLRTLQHQQPAPPPAKSPTLLLSSNSKIKDSSSSISSSSTRVSPAPLPSITTSLIPTAQPPSINLIIK